MTMVLSTVTLYVGFLLIILVLVKPLGGYMARIFAGEKTVLDPLLFALVIIGTAAIVVALTYLPAIALGPIIEQFHP